MEAFTSNALGGKKIKSKGLFGPILENIYRTVSSVYNNEPLRKYLKSSKKTGIKDFNQAHVAFASKDKNGCSASRRLLKILSTSANIFPTSAAPFKSELEKLKFLCQIIFNCVCGSAGVLLRARSHGSTLESFQHCQVLYYHESDRLSLIGLPSLSSIAS